jgi:nucleoside-diphosphate-sugar epimerase
MDPTQKIVVCGGGGFIGGHLVAGLLANGFTDLRCADIKPLDQWHQRSGDVENLRLDLREPQDCRRAVEGAAVVYNLAAEMGGMGFISTHNSACMLSVLINTNLCTAARDAGAGRFFYASSACVYNVDKQRDARGSALKEEDAYPASPQEGYGWEKLFSERMCRHFREDFGLQTRVARFHNVYGPMCTYDGGRETAVAAMCRKVIRAKLSGANEIEIWGTGEQTRSFMYVADCVKGVLMITMGQDVHGRPVQVLDPINLGSGELVSINQLVDLVEEIAGVKLRRKYKPDAPTGVGGRNSDNTRIKQLLRWEPATPLRDGLEKTYRWIYDQVVRKPALH